MKFARMTVGMSVLGMVGLGLIASHPDAGLAQKADLRNPLVESPRPLYVTQPNGVFVQNLIDGSVANLDHQVGTLVRDYAKTQDETKRAKIKADLSAALDKQFENQQKQRDAEVKSIENQLKKLRAVMEKRNEARQSIVQHRLDQLLREAEGLGWAPPRTGNSGYRVFQQGDFTPLQFNELPSAKK